MYDRSITQFGLVRGRPRVDCDYLVKGLGRRWAKPFVQLCQWKLPVTSIVERHLRALKGQLERYGDPPVSICQAFGSWREIDPEEQTTIHERLAYLDHVVYQSTGEKRANALARRACLLHVIRNGYPVEGTRFAVTQSYVEVVYKADYEELVRQSRVQHGYPVTPDMLRGRLHDIRPHVEEGISYFARQLYQHGEVSKLRLPPQQREVPDGYMTESIRIE